MIMNTFMNLLFTCLTVAPFKIPYMSIHTNKDTFYHFDRFPRLDYPNDNGHLTWYPVGFSKDFGTRVKRVTVRDVNFAVWRDDTDYYAVRDCCSHQGSSFLSGETYRNTVTCPYHGYIFDGKNGELLEIPKMRHIPSCTQNIDCYRVVEKGDIVYLNTVPLKNELKDGLKDGLKNRENVDDSSIFVEPEYYDRDHRVVCLAEDFEHYAKLVTVNSLDICHIGFVHTFGNRDRPNPLHLSKIIKMNDTDFHYKIQYMYSAGEKSLVNMVFNFDRIIVENEYVLPHTTVARVIFGKYSSTIITHALPVSKFKTKLFVKAYRSYWSHDLNKNKFDFMSPLLYLINLIGDRVTENTMYNTLKQDKAIVDNIDKTDYEGKFSILYDMFSNHYKNAYKSFYEEEI